MKNIKFNCPWCDQHLEAPSYVQGEIIQCPTCKKELLVPFRRRYQCPTAGNKGTPLSNSRSSSISSFLRSHQVVLSSSFSILFGLILIVAGWRPAARAHSVNLALQRRIDSIVWQERQWVTTRAADAEPEAYARFCQAEKAVDREMDRRDRGEYPSELPGVTLIVVGIAIILGTIHVLQKRKENIDR